MSDQDKTSRGCGRVLTDFILPLVVADPLPPTLLAVLALDLVLIDDLQPLRVVRMKLWEGRLKGGQDLVVVLGQADRRARDGFEQLFVRGSVVHAFDGKLLLDDGVVACCRGTGS